MITEYKLFKRQHYCDVFEYTYNKYFAFEFQFKTVKLLFGHLLVPHTIYWPVVCTCLLAIVGTKGVVTMDRRAPGGYTADGAPNRHGIHNLTTSLQL